jgi:hypothetical protein
MSGLDQLKQKEKDRFKVLQAMYEAAEEVLDGIPFFTPEVVAPAVELDVLRVGQIFDYLEGEGLVETVAFGHTIVITHQGKMEVEAYLRNPERGTEHFNFGPLNFYGAVGVVQSGRENTATVTQNIGSDMQDILGLISQLRAEVSQLPSEVQEEARAELADLEDEIAKPIEKPNRIRKITASLESLVKLGGGIAKFGSVVNQIAAEAGIHLPGQLPPS